MSVNTKVNGQLVKSAGLYKASAPIGMADIYSTEEKEVGLWIDNKPLYQKTLQLSNLTIPSGSRLIKSLSDLGLSDVETVAYSELLMDLNGTKRTMSSFQVSTFSQYGNAYYVDESEGLVISRGSGGNMTADFILTLRYTKTTDVAGSGIYVPSGDKAVHYSADEEVIGTFLGKTLYRKVYSFTSNVEISMTGWTDVNTYIPNIGFETFVSCTGVDANGTSQGNILCGINSSNHVQMLSTRNGNAHIAVTKIILEYTKTS